MKADNVVVRESEGLYIAYYIAEDAPILDGYGATKESAINSLTGEWKRFRNIIDQSVECYGVADGC